MSKYNQNQKSQHEKPLNICISGISGRMGRQLMTSAADRDKYNIVCGLSSLRGEQRQKNTEIVTSDCAIPIFKSLPEAIASTKSIDVIIDFSEARFAHKIITDAAKHSVPIVSGTTGFDESELLEIAEMAKKSLIFHANNTSIVANLMMDLVAKVASTLDHGYDIEILDHHHKDKIDAPSGTSMNLYRFIAKARGLDYAKAYNPGREGRQQQKQQDEIGIAVIRGGRDMVAENKVMFASDSDRIEISHRVTKRDVYTSGALLAMKFLLTQKPDKLYTMEDLLRWL